MVSRSNHGRTDTPIFCRRGAGCVLLRQREGAKSAGFKSAEHRTLFAADPEHYAPQFDGYCAVQVSRGHKVEADPEAWTITNGKLYVFSGKPGVPIFQEQPVAIAKKANENWSKLRATQ
ncbi:MAG: hypothetical protein E6G86_19900 [Alphaproteobacteria bacterium]|nr:MAG: hypothetical protein E6G86_19900 [Alphaproteobacteria bacterium]